MDSGNGHEYNQDQPEDILPGAVQYLPPGTDIKFIKDNIGQPTYKHLLKIKHLFHASLIHTIDFRPFLKILGIERIPSDLSVLNSLSMGVYELGVIDCLYEAQRSIELIDPIK